MSHKISWKERYPEARYNESLPEQIFPHMCDARICTAAYIQKLDAFWGVLRGKTDKQHQKRSTGNKNSVARPPRLLTLFSATYPARPSSDAQALTLQYQWPKAQEPRYKTTSFEWLEESGDVKQCAVGLQNLPAKWASSMTYKFTFIRLCQTNVQKLFTLPLTSYPQSKSPSC